MCVAYIHADIHTYIFGRIYAVNYAPATICQYYYSYLACFETKLKLVNIWTYYLDIYISNMR